MGDKRLVAVAMDGPVASGKSVVGKLIAERMGYQFLDTGMMYRAVTWAAIQRRTPLDDKGALEQIVDTITIRLTPSENGERLTVDGKDITDHLRDSQLESSVSIVAKVSGVRRKLVRDQREIARRRSIVMVGRDIGTIVLPDAQIKIFLTASVNVRAQRRYRELQDKGNQQTYDRVLDDLRQRDKIDSERKDSPLIVAEDALTINTDRYTIQESADKIISLLKIC